MKDLKTQLLMLMLRKARSRSQPRMKRRIVWNASTRTRHYATVNLNHPLVLLLGGAPTSIETNATDRRRHDRLDVFCIE